jgi:hypothetical protein
MNKFFGSMLRQELIDFMRRSELLRARASSIGSQRLSLDSCADPDPEDAGPRHNEAGDNDALTVYKADANDALTVVKKVSTDDSDVLTVVKKFFRC